MEEGRYREQAEFEPNEATLAAWEARNYMMAYRDSEPDTETSQQLLAATHESFERMVKSTESQLRGSLVARTGQDYEATVEIMQETYLRAYKHLRKFRGDSQIDTWLHRIAFNQLATYYKKRAKDTDSIPLDYLPNEDGGEAILTDPANTETHVEQREDLRIVMDSISNLQPRHRAVIELKYKYDKSHEQIAQILGITVTNSKVILKRVRDKLHKNIEEPEE